MRCLLCVPLCLTATMALLLAAEKGAIFEPGAKLKIQSAAGSGGEGPAWHPRLGVLTSGNGCVVQLDLSLPKTPKWRVYVFNRERRKFGAADKVLHL